MLPINEINSLIAQKLSSDFSEAPNTTTVFTVQLDSVPEVATLDADGAENDLVGTAFLIKTDVTELEGGCGGETIIKRFAKQFSYFMVNGKDVYIRELNPVEKVNPNSGEEIPPICSYTFYNGGRSTTGSKSCYPRNDDQVNEWVADLSANADPIKILIGDFDESLPGNEISIVSLSEGMSKLLGTINITNLK